MYFCEWLISLSIVLSSFIHAAAYIRMLTLYFRLNYTHILHFWGAPKSLQMVIAAMKLKSLLLGRKVMTNLDSIFKSRDITLPTKIRLVKAMVFPMVMYGSESWTVKKAEH